MRKRHARGASLIEILVTISVLSLGFLGIASLQTSAIANIHIAYQYSQAASLAQSIVESVRANQAAAMAGLYQHDAGKSTPAPEKKCSATSCTPAELAEWNISSWHSAIASDLSGGKLSISCPKACSNQSIQLITIYWDARRNGATGTGCNPESKSDLSCFHLAYAP